MNSSLIFSWDGIDPKAVYTRQLTAEPFYWDDAAGTWVACSYEYCKAALLNNDLHVPEPVVDGSTLLNEKAAALLKGFARLNNNEKHNEARAAAMTVYESMKPIAVSDMLDDLLADVKNKAEFDWINIVCKKLPVLVILKSLGFSESDCRFVVENISTMVKIMSPGKTSEDIMAINSMADQFYALAEQQVIALQIQKNNPQINTAKTVELYACNLVGLFIQSYDAGRGLLCNALLKLVDNGGQDNCPRDRAYFEKLVTETLRFDPPVHNTRRIAARDTLIGARLIKAGEPVLIILAAANLDPRVFENPEVFNVMRANNDRHLTFGLGAHSCIAKHLMMDMVVRTCLYLTGNYQYISILQQKFKYEAKTNVRLIKELMINLS